MSRSGTLVTIATYNEMDNLPSLVPSILERLPQAHVLVIDDNSPDGTGDWVAEQAAADSRIQLLRRSGKLGLGSAIVAGMKYAIDHGYEFVINMDADFSHPPEALPRLMAGMNQEGGLPVDVMIGSRYVAGGRIEGWPWLRHFMSRGVNFYARILLGLSAKDTSGGYRAYRTGRLAELDFDLIRSRGYSFQEEVLWRLTRLRCRIAETPITFTDRVRGKSKIHGGEALSALWIILQLAGERLTKPAPRRGIERGPADGSATSTRDRLSNAPTGRAERSDTVNDVSG